MVTRRLHSRALSVCAALACVGAACDNDRPPASPSSPATAAGTGSTAAPAASASARHHGSRRAEAVALNVPGLPNAYRVSAKLYRGAQPEPEGFAALARLGIKTVVNLRLAHSDRDELAESGLPEGALQYEHIRTEAWDADEDEIVRFLRIVTDDAKTPVFVHCEHGADRTGTMVAVYRIVVQGWTKKDAIREMREGPFGFHEIWTGLPGFLKEMDVEALRRKAKRGGPRE